jgi:hypothetical protein
MYLTKILVFGFGSFSDEILGQTPSNKGRELQEVYFTLRVRH